MIALAISMSFAAETRRFALVAGANDGGPDRVELHWAQSDAREVAGVLTTIGGVASADEILLTDPRRDDFQRAIGDLATRVGQSHAAGLRTELIVYYSGHSDDDGLLLGTTTFGYADLRAQLAAVPADVRVVVLDSCSSGEVALALPPGTYDLLIDRPDGKREGTFTLVDGETVDVSTIALRSVQGEVATARGGDAPAGDAYRDVPLSIGILPEIAMPMVGGPVRQHLAIALVLNGAAALDGAQIAVAGNNVTDPSRGTRVSAAWNYAGRDFTRVQLSSGVDIARGSFHGAQIAAGLAVGTGEVHGVQLSSGLNVAGTLAGVQVSAGLNVATGGSGTQVAPVNVVGTFRGAHIGVINVGKSVEGTQIGIVNISDDVKGSAIGLITIQRTGYHHLEGWVGDEPVNLGAVFGGRHVYTVLQGGALPGPNSRLTALMGFGGHGGDRLFVDIDVSGGTAHVAPIVDNPSYGIVRARAMVGWRVIPHVAPFAGLTLTAVPWESTSGGAYPTPLPAFQVAIGNTTIPMWLGFVAGLRV